jgi:hypothetical protein
MQTLCPKIIEVINKNKAEVFEGVDIAALKRTLAAQQEELRRKVKESVDNSAIKFCLKFYEVCVLPAVPCGKTWVTMDLKGRWTLTQQSMKNPGYLRLVCDYLCPPWTLHGVSDEERSLCAMDSVIETHALCLFVHGYVKRNKFIDDHWREKVPWDTSLGRAAPIVKELREARLEKAVKDFTEGLSGDTLNTARTKFTAKLSYVNFLTVQPISSVATEAEASDDLDW